ncbi:Uncharacterised protein [Neisseria weaveri]|uniref:Uncharacterized protein n=1 Tax=Neisseria weaveri TaxID=28091 RepID=A0A448VHT6_9NEIS|nr:Uncharacterised protein [Neisseria weaveri]
MFQHTAARRRLFNRLIAGLDTHRVSTHSRPKAAVRQKNHGFGVWKMFQHTAARRRLFLFFLALFIFIFLFQHTAARRRLFIRMPSAIYSALFQHTAARRRLSSKSAAVPS